MNEIENQVIDATAIQVEDAPALLVAPTKSAKQTKATKVKAVPIVEGQTPEQLAVTEESKAFEKAQKEADKASAKAGKVAAKEAAKAPIAKPEREVSNGVKKPLVGSKCWKVWDLISKVGKQIGETPSIGEVQERAKTYANEDGTVEALNPGNVNAEYNQFRKFYSLPKVDRTPTTK